MEGTVVFDFDYTLFDAARLKEEMAASLAGCGVPPEAFWDAYAQASASADKICDYDPARHVDMLAGRLTCSRDEALRRIEAVVARAPEFLMPGAVSLLRRLKSEGATLVLLTHGNPAWQERKAERSGLLPHFARAVFAAENKERAPELAALEGPVVMVNDNGREIDAIAAAFPDFRMIAVRGPKPAPSDPAVPVCEDIEQVYKAVSDALR